MRLEEIALGEKKVMPFTIPSGIITTSVPTIIKYLGLCDELGIITTKSIGPKPRDGNREPILLQYMPLGFMNAVGLTNPGAEEFARQLNEAGFPDIIPQNKFLLASIFGGDKEEFVYVAKILERFVDGFELNLSCPHVKGHGMQLGQDPEIVYEIVRGLSRIINKPLIVKLTPNTSNLGDIARASIRGRAYGISGINTVGPGYWEVGGHPVLNNRVGGISGPVIFPIGLKCLREVRQAIGLDPFVLWMGGVKSPEDSKTYFNNGANAVGVGTILAGLNDNKNRRYFESSVREINKVGWSSGDALSLLEEVNMEYEPATVIRKINHADNLKTIELDWESSVMPGQFVFAWIPGVGEKPFSVARNPISLTVQERGCFTRAFNQLEKGDKLFVRGPYGRGFHEKDQEVYCKNVGLVAGGCGIPGVSLFAEQLRFSSFTTFLGASDKNHLSHLDLFYEKGDVFVATEDGSYKKGIKGVVTDLFDRPEFMDNPVFFNCGPKAMIKAVLPYELEVTGPKNIYSSLDYMTRCGVGLCGSCSDEKGRRTCMEGPFVNLEN